MASREPDRSEPKHTNLGRPQLREKLITLFSELAKQHGSPFVRNGLNNPHGEARRLIISEINKTFGVFLRGDRLSAQLDLEQIAELVNFDRRGKPKALVFPRISSTKQISLAEALQNGEYGTRNTANVTVESEIGPYKVTRFLGRGGFGSAFLAKSADGQSKVAIKVAATNGGGQEVTRLYEISHELTQHGISADEAPAEAVAFTGGNNSVTSLSGKECEALLVAQASRLQECSSVPGIAEFNSMHEVGDSIAMVSKFVRGDTLRQKIRRLDGIHLNWFLRAAETCLRIDGHGDLKPENIILTKSHDIVLIDPAVSISTGGRDVATMTPCYNPLLERGQGADVRALGIMIYEILTGITPFDSKYWPWEAWNSEDETTALSRQYFLSYCPATTLNSKTPEALERLENHCITQQGYGLQDFIEEVRTFIDKVLPKSKSHRVLHGRENKPFLRN